MRHFILTRFAVTMPLPYPSRLEDSSWLSSRLELVESFTLPSIAAQSIPVTWLIGVDRSVPSWTRKRLSAIARQVDAHIVTTDGIRVGWAEAVHEVLKSCSNRPLATTRLDSDDAIAWDFSERVREFGKRGVVSFARGAQLDRKSGAANHLNEAANPFLTLVSTEGISILDAVPKHHILEGVPDLTIVQGPPAWLQVVHDNNLANFVFRRQEPLSQRDLREMFVVAEHAFPREPGLSFVRRSAAWYVRRSLRALRHHAVRVSRPRLQ